jgi:nucleotide-binding universal stress UspA family protein
MAAKSIVAGTDGSEESLRAVGWAAREAALRGVPLRIVAAAALLPRMSARVGTVEYANVTDVLISERDSALAAAAERAARAADGVLIDTDELSGAGAR